MSAGACKLILDSETLNGIGEAANHSRALEELLDESPIVWEISALCAQLSEAVTETLKGETR